MIPLKLRAFARLLSVDGFDVETCASAEDFIYRADARVVNSLARHPSGGVSARRKASLPAIFVKGELRNGREQIAQNVAAF
jgi:predicted NUDIX family NTP pyrophosphohydrolase